MPGRAPAGDGSGWRAAGSEQGRHCLAVVGQHRRLEQCRQGERDAQLVGQASGGLGGGDGVAAQQQEVVVCRHCLHLEDVAPYAGDARLQRISGCRSGVGWVLVREPGIAIQAAIGHAQAAGRTLQLAAGGLRQCPGVQQQDHRRGLAAGIGDDLAQGLDQVMGLDRLLHVATDFHRHADALLTLVLDGKYCHPAFAQHLDFAFEGFSRSCG